jgi:hypothetical protein
VRIGIGYSKEERQRIIRCCGQVLHQESKLLGERFGGKPSGPVRIGRFPQDRRQNRAFQADYFRHRRGGRRLRIVQEQGRTTVPAGLELQGLVCNRRISDRRGSSVKQTPHVSGKGVRCRAQWIWNTRRPLTANPYCPRRAAHILDTDGQNVYLPLPWTNRCGEPGSQSVDLRIHSIGKVGNFCRSSSALIFCPVTLKNFANAERVQGESWSSTKAPRSENFREAGFNPLN